MSFAAGDCLFVTDFDGTLLNDEKTISGTDTQTLCRLQDQGVIVAIATGRSLYSFHRALAHAGIIGLPVDYVVFSTGAGILDWRTGRILRSLFLARSEVLRIIPGLDEMKIDYMIHNAIPDTQWFLYKSQGPANLDFHHRIRLYAGFGTPLTSLEQVYAAATQVLGILPEEQWCPDRKQQLLAEFPEFSVIHATSPLDHRSAWIEVFHGQVSKSRAISWICRERGIPASRVIDVGNDHNDVDLLEWSGQGFVLANTPPDVTAGIRLPVSHNENGVTRAAQLSGLMRG